MHSSKRKSVSLPFVSCLCVTQNKMAQLIRAVECFYSQTYPHKELVIVHKGDSEEIEDWLGRKKRRNIKLIEVLASTMTRGELRNIAIANASGEYFCQWDDDDWYHCDRLKIQISELLKYDQPASVLYYLLVFDSEKRQLYLSMRRVWGWTLLCKTKVFPAIKFQPWPKYEDANFIHQVLIHHKVVPIMIPGLYIYVCNGHNVSDEERFHRLFNESQQLSERAARLVQHILNGKYNNVDASRLLGSDFLLKELNFLHGYLQSIKQDKHTPIEV